MSGFKVQPTRKDKPLVDPSMLAQFAMGAELPKDVAMDVPKVDQTNEKPDFELLDNKRRITSFGMRFTARELAKLKYIASTTPDSMHEFCLKAIQKALENTK